MANNQNPPRGSKKHIRDLILHSDYLKTMNSLVSEYKAKITKDDISCPNPKDPLHEKSLRTFCRKYLSKDFNFKAFENWWNRRKNPTWDLISTCSIAGRKGLIIVEAKAHEAEMDYSGKPKPKKGKEESRKNYNKISRRIDEARKAIARQIGRRISIIIESHYQLSNRIAMGWKLADCGLPVILLYLGFTGDTSLEKYFENDEHWQRVMGAYMRKFLSLNFPGVPIKGENNATMVMLIRFLCIRSE